VLAFAHRFTHSLEEEASHKLEPRRLVVEAAQREHVGLGVGTQLGLAVARLLAESWGKSFGIEELARRVGRGERSALGAHGFVHGGFLVDGGKAAETALAPLVARAEFPNHWRIVVVLPEAPAGLHGSTERAAFDRLCVKAPFTNLLCRLVLL